MKIEFNGRSISLHKGDDKVTIEQRNTKAEIRLSVKEFLAAAKAIEQMQK